MLLAESPHDKDSDNLLKAIDLKALLLGFRHHYEVGCLVASRRAKCRQAFTFPRGEIILCHGQDFAESLADFAEFNNGGDAMAPG